MLARIRQHIVAVDTQGSGLPSNVVDGPRAATFGSTRTFLRRPLVSSRPRRWQKNSSPLQPDVIVVQSTPYTAALQQQTRTIPIVFVHVSDPIGSGFATSLARPGGNLTGLLLFEGSIAGKWIGMLKEITPRLQRVAVLHNPDVSTFYPRAAEALAPSLSVEVVSNPVDRRTSSAPFNPLPTHQTADS
jgi:ABC transporter substrate binding protein